MAGYNSTVLPFKMEAVVVRLEDGTGTPQALTLYLLQGSKVTYNDPGRKKVEVKHGGRRLSTPVVVETEDQDITGQVVFLVTTFVAASGMSPFEFMKGTIPSFISTGVGGAKQMRMEVDYVNTEDDASGVTQTATFSHITFDNFAVDPAGADGLTVITADFTARLQDSRVAYA